MRALLDKMLSWGIKVCMLTGVAFTFAACYGPPPEGKWWNDPDYQSDQQQVEQQLQTAAQNAVEVEVGD